ncbi:hypothetical protein F0562_025700 [Nyssa sinensis]|uniref:Uncharacterized protein n=1 Tax=Nyssa sinensis TaxID=561372 RepID=A0A5J5B8U5_9ASTE|nr:hypothetical protein F0562_025700 [Nyssa sinensis]
MKVRLIQPLAMDLKKQVLAGFKPLKKKRVGAGEPTTLISAKKAVLADESSSKKTRSNTCSTRRAYPSSYCGLESLNVYVADHLECSTLSKARRGFSHND